jgi:hypothetical protein
MTRTNDIMRFATIAAFLAGVAFLFLPANTAVTALPLLESPGVQASVPGARAHADSLAEDIILSNLFASSRTAPSRRYAGPGTNANYQAGTESAEPASAGFAPALLGTAVSETPGATRALLQLDPADLTPRLYAVGEGAGGYRVVSIEARSVQLTGPRGRVVLRLPQDREEHS